MELQGLKTTSLSVQVRQHSSNKERDWWLPAHSEEGPSLSQSQTKKRFVFGCFPVVKWSQIDSKNRGIYCTLDYSLYSQINFLLCREHVEGVGYLYILSTCTQPGKRARSPAQLWVCQFICCSILLSKHASTGCGCPFTLRWHEGQSVNSTGLVTLLVEEHAGSCSLSLSLRQCVCVCVCKEKGERDTPHFPFLWHFLHKFSLTLGLSLSLFVLSHSPSLTHTLGIIFEMSWS